MKAKRGKKSPSENSFFPKNHKGQFYLIAAVIIITVIVGFITISNYSKKRTSVKLYDLGEELGIESQNVLDYGTFTYPDDEEGMNALWESFIENYKDYAGGGKDLYFIFGDSGSLQVKAYEDLEEVDYDLTTNGGKISIVIEDIEYQFDLKAEDNFYFVISQEIEGEKYVITG